jgi:hypothetical protein
MDRFGDSSAAAARFFFREGPGCEALRDGDDSLYGIVPLHVRHGLRKLCKVCSGRISQESLLGFRQELVQLGSDRRAEIFPPWDEAFGRPFEELMEDGAPLGRGVRRTLLAATLLAAGALLGWLAASGRSSSGCRYRYPQAKAVGRLSVPPFAAWKDLPGFDRIQRPRLVEGRGQETFDPLCPWCSGIFRMLLTGV